TLVVATQGLPGVVEPALHALAADGAPRWRVALARPARLLSDGAGGFWCVTGETLARRFDSAGDVSSAWGFDLGPVDDVEGTPTGSVGGLSETTGTRGQVAQVGAHGSVELEAWIEFTSPLTGVSPKHLAWTPEGWRV